MKPLLIYFADPMCSWCWGFSPVIKHVRERYEDNFEISLVAGGLAPGTTEPVDEYRRASIREHWRHVTELTGQPFDMRFFDRESFIYDTEPACRAVVTVRLSAPGSEFDYLAALHEAFYAHNRDITQPATLSEIAAECGCGGDDFIKVFADPETHLATGNDFSITQSAGIRGFPALVVGDEPAGLTALTVGYQEFSPMAGAIDAWLARPDA